MVGKVGYVCLHWEYYMYIIIWTHSSCIHLIKLQSKYSLANLEGSCRLVNWWAVCDILFSWYCKVKSKYNGVSKYLSRIELMSILHFESSCRGSSENMVIHQDKLLWEITFWCCRYILLGYEFPTEIL